MGVRIQDITAELAADKGIENIKGVFIPEVVDGGAADKAGIKADDVILKIDGEAVNKASELQEEISKYHPGDDVTVTILRSGKTIEKSVKLLSKDGKKEISTETVREAKNSTWWYLGKHRTHGKISAKNSQRCADKINR